MPDDSSANEPFAHIHALRAKRIAAIRAGALPETGELLSGCPFLCESAELDWQAYFEDWSEEPDGLDFMAPKAKFDALHRAAVALKRTFKLDKILIAIKAAEAVKASDLTKRLYIYAARMGDQPTRTRVAAMALHEGRSLDPSAPANIYVAIGMVSSSKSPTPDMALSAGRKALWKIAQHQREFDRLAAIEAADNDDGDFAFDEDRAEFFSSGNTTVDLLKARIAGKRTGASVVVVPPMAPPAQAHRRESLAVVMPVIGKALALTPKPDLVALQQAMDGEFPWAAPVTATLLRDLALSDCTVFRPTLIVGPPGQAKSTYARRFLEAAGLVTELLPLAGMSDSSLMGTSIQWSSARPSDALRLIARARAATVGIVLDEVDKTTKGNNGSATDALLPFLERSTSKAIRDLALETEVDLSWISWLATANDLTAVPGPLRDRMRILRMPAPGMQHIGSISRRILDDIARSRGEDPRFIPSLEPDEIESISDFWTDGSLRRLRRILEILVDGRDHFAGRC